MSETTSQPETTTQEVLPFRAEMKQLLELIAHSLYQHKDIFLRELISNASDALNKIRFRMLTDREVLDPGAKLEIRLTLDEEKKTLTLSDTGIGMTRAELIENLGTVAKSGTKGFIEQIKKGREGDAGKGDAADLIGQFGVGFYSAFMVAHKITVRSRSANLDAAAAEWVSDGGGTFAVAPCEKAERGTDIILELRADEEDFARRYRVENIIRKYSKYVVFPIRIGDEQINESRAIWTRPKSEIKKEEYNEFFNTLVFGNDPPLATIHVQVDSPVQYSALLFIPANASMEELTGTERKGLKLYCRKVFVHDDERELLPHYLRFVCGVIDSEDLPLNVSREVVQNDPRARKISKALTSKVLAEIDELSKVPETRATFWKSFGRSLKEGIHSDFENRDKLLDLVRFESSTSEPGTLVTLAEVAGRMKEKQPAIYTISGENREALLESPKLELLRRAGVEVLLFLDPIDDFVIGSAGSYKEKSFEDVDRADLSWIERDAEQAESAPAEDLAAIVEAFKAAAGPRVSEVRPSERLVESPCALVAAKEGMTGPMARLMRMTNKDHEEPKKVLEVNARSPLIRAIAKRIKAETQDPLVAILLAQLIDAAFLMEGELENPKALVRRDIDLMEKLLAAPR